MRILTEYNCDETNTRTETVLMTMVGGGKYGVGSTEPTWVPECTFTTLHKTRNGRPFHGSNIATATPGGRKPIWPPVPSRKLPALFRSSKCSASIATTRRRALSNLQVARSTPPSAQAGFAPVSPFSERPESNLSRPHTRAATKLSREFRPAAGAESTFKTHVQHAKAALLKNDLKKAGRELRAAGEYLGKAGASAPAAAKEGLEASAWTKKDTKTTWRALKGAADDLEDGATAVGRDVGDSSKDVTKGTREIAGKLVQDGPPKRSAEAWMRLARSLPILAGTRDQSCDLRVTAGSGGIFRIDRRGTRMR